MTASVESNSRHATTPVQWTPWRARIGTDLAAGDPRLAHLQLQTFRLLAAFAFTALLMLAGRGILIGEHFPWADLVNGILFAVLFVLSFVQPRQIKLLYWLGLLTLFVNAIDGLEFAGVVPHILILLSLLVLYGSLLGDFRLGLTALGGVAAIYAYTWVRLGHLAPREVYIMTDICLLTLFTGAAALSVWLYHRRLEKELFFQAAALREELDLRSRLQAIIAHDIRNPLTVLLQAVDVDDPRAVQTMAQRIATIVEAAGDLAAGPALKLSEVTVADIGFQLEEVFAARLARKGQTLAVAAAPALVLRTDVPILCNSVLGNILSNAIKFSPRGSTIALTAAREDDRVRIVITDQGSGFPVDVASGGPKQGYYRSQPGTEGEPGSGYGLPIAALCAERLGGSIEIRNDDRGGAAVSVLLPYRKHPAGPVRAGESAT